MYNVGYSKGILDEHHYFYFFSTLLQYNFLEYDKLTQESVSAHWGTSQCPLAITHLFINWVFEQKHGFPLVPTLQGCSIMEDTFGLKLDAESREKAG